MYYKLTNQNMQTHNGFQWVLGEWKEATGHADQGLCSDGWLHCYDSPLLATLHNPIHANVVAPRLFEIETAGETLNDRGMMRGWQKMRLVAEISLPKISREQSIAYAILCAKAVYVDPDFVAWADKWLSGEDRSPESATWPLSVTWPAKSAARSATKSAAWATSSMSAGLAAESAAKSPTKVNLVEIAKEAICGISI